MKVQMVQNIGEIADIPQDKNQPIVTRDGAKLVTMSIVGSNPVSAIMGTFTGMLNMLEGIDRATLSDKTLYLIPGGLVTSLGEHRFSVVIGITGVTDLEDRLRSLPSNILAKPDVVQAEPVSVQPDPTPVV